MDIIDELRLFANDGLSSDPRSRAEMKAIKELLRARHEAETSCAIIWRLREITSEPYFQKHGKHLTTERGWAWEMVHFIHHKFS